MRRASMIASDVGEKQEAVGAAQLLQDERMLIHTAAYGIANRDRHSEARPNQLPPCVRLHCPQRSATTRQSRVRR